MLTFTLCIATLFHLCQAGGTPTPVPTVSCYSIGFRTGGCGDTMRSGESWWATSEAECENGCKGKALNGFYKGSGCCMYDPEFKQRVSAELGGMANCRWATTVVRGKELYGLSAATKSTICTVSGSEITEAEAFVTPDAAVSFGMEDVILVGFATIGFFAVAGSIYHHVTRKVKFTDVETNEL